MPFFSIKNMVALMFFSMCLFFTMYLCVKEVDKQRLKTHRHIVFFRHLS